MILFYTERKGTATQNVCIIYFCIFTETQLKRRDGERRGMKQLRKKRLFLNVLARAPSLSQLSNIEFSCSINWSRGSLGM